MSSFCAVTVNFECNFMSRVAMQCVLVSFYFYCKYAFSCSIEIGGFPL